MSLSDPDQTLNEPPSFTRYCAAAPADWVVNCLCGAFIIAILPLLVWSWFFPPVNCGCDFHHLERVPILSPEYRFYEPKKATPENPVVGNQPVKETWGETIMIAVLGGGLGALFYYVVMLPIWGPLSRGWIRRAQAQSGRNQHMISSSDCRVSVRWVFPLLFVCAMILVEFYQMLTTTDLQPGSWSNPLGCFVLAGKYAVTTMVLAIMWSALGELIHSEDLRANASLQPQRTHLV